MLGKQTSLCKGQWFEARRPRHTICRIWQMQKDISEYPCRASSTARSSHESGRRELIATIMLSIPAFPLTSHAADTKSSYEPMYSLKGKDYGKERQKYSDYVRTESGLQYQDIREGQGETPKEGSLVAIDWDGYTIGYYGRPFQARNKAKGGSFGQGADRELYKFTINGKEAIPAVEEAVLGMKPGGIRRLIVPVELGYPENNMNKKGPKPTTFSGERALDFVLKNQGMIDKTLLIDVELVKIF